MEVTMATNQKAVTLLFTQGIILLKGRITEEVKKEFENSMLWLNTHGKNEGVERIKIYITSQGGLVVPALEMYEILQKSKLPTTSIVVKKAASMAIIVHQGASLCLAEKSAEYGVIHRLQPHKNIPAEVKELVICELQKNQENVDVILMRRLLQGMSDGAVFTELQKIYDTERTFSALEAAALGLIDGIV